MMLRYAVLKELFVFYKAYGPGEFLRLDQLETRGTDVAQYVAVVNDLLRVGLVIGVEGKNIGLAINPARVKEVDAMLTVTRRVFVSMPNDECLTEAQNELKWGLVDRIETLGYVPEIFMDQTGRKSRCASQTWSAERVEEILRDCHGAALIGVPRWKFEGQLESVLIPTEFSHYEGALAKAQALPLLVIAQDNLMRRVVFDDSFGSYIARFPEGAGKNWLDERAFKVPFEIWRQQLANRRDVFLGYSGASEATASLLRNFLENEIGATVLDWKRDFTPGRSILEEIEEARRRCTLGLFLFTKDDLLANNGAGAQSAPRDNVVFEAGYFVSAKGKKRVLIVLEKGAKMPADLGGDIYVSLEDRADISLIRESIVKFLKTL
jgi:hypothetical protein